jgi:probable F420-dependent oxidoreductase
MRLFQFFSPRALHTGCELQLGVIFPQTELQRDPGAVKAYAQGVESLGYKFIAAYDHVIGANPASRPGWRGTYDVDDAFLEPVSLFSFIAGVTSRVGLVTSILILPQRQTVLTAKQAATLDVLSGGRLRLGIGIGWNDIEYEALGMGFNDRGKRSEEQIELMRLLWKNRSVNFEGKWHRVVDAGINPLPVQRPIPVWLGGGAEPVIQRVARIADGWMPQFQPDTRGKDMFERMKSYAQEYGRDPAAIGLDGRVTATGDDVDAWAETVSRWKLIGATHVSVNTMGDRMREVEKHLDKLRRLKEAVGKEAARPA